MIDIEANAIVAFFSLLTDQVLQDDVSCNSRWNKLRKLLKINHPRKSFKSFPALKIGRLAVDTEYKNIGIGTFLISAIKSRATTLDVGCRLLTVDAYRSAIKFYEKKNFVFLENTDDGSNTRLMLYDLMKIQE